ncbi:MAG: DUF4878 domain-containing protein [Mediterranea massiliensis]|nr:DUF4878 domain-containing protein [Mediterranea massiliensis]
MLMKRVLSIFAIVAALFMVSCGGSTPSDAAVEVYQMIIDGKYDAVAENMYYESTDAEEVEQSKALIASMLKEKAAPQFEKKGGIKNVEALSETIAGDGQSAVVELKITYGDGSEETEKAEMKLDGGEWKPAVDK